MDTALLELLLILALVVLNGFFACAEFAIISIRASRVAQLVADGDERAAAVADMQRDPHRLLAVVQVGMTLTGATASALSGIIAVEHLKPVLLRLPVAITPAMAEPIAVTLMVGLVSYLILVLGELAPKAVGLQYADSIAPRVARTIAWLAKVGSLAVSFLSLSSKGLLALFGLRSGGHSFISRDEVRHIVTEGQKAGTFTRHEEEYIRKVFDFTHTLVREVMVPRTRIVGLDLALPRERLIRLALENQYSRYPVYRDDIEQVIGILHVKDLMGRLYREAEVELAELVRPALFAPELQKVSDLLREMQRSRRHMALVVDEYGSVSGLVTTEDLLEELVGEIADEHDVGEPRAIRRLPDGSLIVDALVSVYDLAEQLQVKLPAEAPYDTLAGLILHELGRFPERGEKLAWHGYELTCVDVRRTSIVSVRIKKPAAEADD